MDGIRRDKGRSSFPGAAWRPPWSQTPAGHTEMPQKCVASWNRPRRGLPPAQWQSGKLSLGESQANSPGVCGGPRGKASPAALSPSPRCRRIFSITSGSSMLAMIFTRPPQCSHFSMSIVKTRFRRRAQFIRTAGGALPCVADSVSLAGL
jgi:hypothetical protein